MKSFYYGFATMIEKSGCHRLPERSFFYKGKQFPICARCTGVLIGQTLGFWTYLLWSLPWELGLFFCGLMLLDWFIQRIDLRRSTNLRRCITGVLCGYAFGQWYFIMLSWVGQAIIGEVLS